MSDKRQDDKEYLSAVATALGPGWRAEFDAEYDLARVGQLTHADGRAIAVWRTPTRYELCGLYPHGQHPALLPQAARRTASITVGRNRDATAMAREITRRLLPGYTEMFVALRAQADAAATLESHRVEALRRIARALGMPEDIRADEALYPADPRINRIAVLSDGNVRIELRLSVDATLTLLESLKEA